MEQMTSAELYAWLSSFINMEQGLGGKPSTQKDEHFKLDRMMTFAELAGHPERSSPVIHVAGSKGKGSVTAMVSSILEQAGIKTARYMSPHVSDWRERISRGEGSFFSEACYAKAGGELRDVYQRFREQYPAWGEPTFFELMTLLFFLCARNEQCGAMAVETGLGGRLDATNIVDPGVSVITVIEKEHTEYLGNTLAEIAGEKAGIIKRGRPVVSAEQKSEALAVLRKKTREENTPFIYAPEAAAFPKTGLSGKAYEQNAALAVEAVRLAFPGIDKDCVSKGLSALRLPARFEKLRESPPFIVDGAHTPLSVAQCAETFLELYNPGGILIFACAADKDPSAMAEILLPCFSHCVITSTGNFRASDPAAVYKVFLAAAESRVQGGLDPAASANISCIADTEAAITEALRLSDEQKLPVLACGSFYLAGEIRKKVKQRDR